MGKKIYIIMILPLSVLLNFVFSRNANFVEKYYSNGINKPTRQFLSLVTGIFSFSLGEILVYFFVILILLMIGKVVYSSIKDIKNSIECLKDFLVNILCIVSIIYFLFLFLWGFNYDRTTFGETASLKVRPSSVDELYELCHSLIIDTNDLREKVYENEAGVMEFQEGYKGIFQQAPLAYENLSKEYLTLSGKYGKPKNVLLSEKMCYTGITGVYFPFTGEANVNVATTDFMLPATVLHEMAHQRGIAREDEANFVAYLACTSHPDDRFKYSGSLLALINSMNALRKTDYEKYKELRQDYSEGVLRDLKYLSDFWQQYEGKTEEVWTKVNDSYLKSNGQETGVKSYGNMVDLLLALKRK